MTLSRRLCDTRRLIGCPVSRRDTVLGTTPLEDVGFPYVGNDRLINQAMLRLSYFAYLIDIGQYAEWVSRSQTPPTHAMLAGYLKWVLHEIGVVPVTGEVTSVSVEGSCWRVAYQDDRGTSTVLGHALVVTGPGDPYVMPETGASRDERRVFNGQDVWQNIALFRGMCNQRIAVIGAGETAAGIVLGLLDVVDTSTKIEIISRHPILFTRNEFGREVMYFYEVLDWSKLAPEHRKTIICHADRGTFSVAAKQRLDAVQNVSVRLGDVACLHLTDGCVSVTGSGDEEAMSYDYVIDARGFDPLSFLRLFVDRSLLGDPTLLADRIDPDLSVSGLVPKLHLPGLSSMAQGPGFPNLSCLGLLAGRILEPYVQRPT